MFLSWERARRRARRVGLTTVWACTHAEALEDPLVCSRAQWALCS
jgi:hypothetical protein